MLPVYTKHFLPTHVALAFATTGLQRSDDTPDLDWKRLIAYSNSRDALGCVEILNKALRYKLSSDRELYNATILSLSAEFHVQQPLPHPLAFRVCPDRTMSSVPLFQLFCNDKLMSIDESDGITATIDKNIQKGDRISDCRK